MPKKKPSAAQKQAIRLAINQKLHKSRNGRVCPHCKSEKPKGWPCCDRCRLVLPQRIKGKLREGLIGYAYNQAHTEMIDYLGRFADTAIVEPEAPKAAKSDDQTQGLL